jgi:UDP-3-O-[3-hydroxymyristoyl] N-acetylglucosamine deacetylase
MAAFYGCKIDNVIAEVDGPEIPIMDGSSRPFIFMLECAGLSYLNKPKRYIKILKEIQVADGDSFIVTSPFSNLKIETFIDFASKSIGKQNRICHGLDDFNKNISSARTFGFVSELKYLNSKGLGLGINLHNAIGIDQDSNLLTELRFNDEFVRHKILDSIGDFYTAGNIVGNFKCHKSGHYLNNQILYEIFSSSNNYQIL